MRMTILAVCFILALATVAAARQVATAPEKIVVAHRGACGYLPEHTLPAKAMAHAMGADYIEQDVVLTKDDVPIVLHDHYLDTISDVARKFPGRTRKDGRYYAIDFTLDEVRSLRASERFDRKTGKAVFPQRFPGRASHFAIPTLAEEIELIQGLNKSTGRNAGIYPEIKNPSFHRKEGKDISKIVLGVLKKYGYETKDDKCFLQCFDAEELRRIREDLGCRLNLVQLVAENDWNEAPTDYDKMKTREGIRKVAEYADGLGPWMPQLVTGVNRDGSPRMTGLLAWAHEQGLKVHPYTFRADAMPDYATSFDDLLRIFYYRAGVDGVFTDFPDKAVTFLRNYRGDASGGK